jgi:hypothetical protein
MSVLRTYAGIGSRKAPSNVMKLMALMAQELELGGFILRSGGADGCDSAFESGVSDPLMKRIYIPWAKFNGRSGPGVITVDRHPIYGKAVTLAKKFHPAPRNLTPASLKLMARNGLQVLGDDLQSPCSFVICYTDGGKQIGGTSQALRIASAYEIPIINLGSSSLQGASVGDIIDTVLNYDNN